MLLLNDSASQFGSFEDTEVNSSHGELMFIANTSLLRYQEIIFCIVKEGKFSNPALSPHLDWILC